ncbi:MAG: ABC transporter permease, partial [Gammaproteobacteria bacterium]
AGLLVALVVILLERRLFPSFPLAIPAWAVAFAVLVALGTGLLFSWLPARRAARLDPVLALNRR